MSDMQIKSVESIGRKFIGGKFLPPGADEYYLRNIQSDRPADSWRRLKASEIETLVVNGNTADDWDNIRVDDKFNPRAVKGCEFYGLVRIGRLSGFCLDYHDLIVPVGITNSSIVSCDIGDDAAVHNVRYLAHYIIGSHVILLNIDEMQTSNHSKFGNGIVKDGEDESVRIWLDLVNENGRREVMPFDGMTPGDAYIWAKYRGDTELMRRLGEITQKQFDSRRGFYGTVGDRCTIKNCRIIKDVKVGPCAYIKGANKLKNLTINSNENQPSQIGEGVELVNGIIGRGCKIFYGCKAVRFVMGECCKLTYGARLINSYLGDNSTISCCEVLNDLIFPSHEQHHNNSFLVAALVKGQSNVAACATVGSNHNSRSPDGEIEAGRGFWPGLCVSVKHCCKFASFTLLAKGDYPAELNIPLPFSLVSDNETDGYLSVMPAYWWMYNMYALARNTWKFQARDTRLTKVQNIEFDSLAPDTVEEMLAAMDTLAIWTAKAKLRDEGKGVSAVDDDQLLKIGRELMEGPADAVAKLKVLGENIENSRRDVVIAKAHAAWHAYRDMVKYYAVRNLLTYMESNPDAKLADMRDALGAPRVDQWVNVGGQLIQADDFEQLKADIKSGSLDSWDVIHKRYDSLWTAYPLAKQKHALASALAVVGEDALSAQAWQGLLDEAAAIQEFVRDQTYATRKKDYDNPFRKITFVDDAERKAVMGTAEDDGFVKQVTEETQQFRSRIEAVKERK